MSMYSLPSTSQSREPRARLKNCGYSSGSMPVDWWPNMPRGITCRARSCSSLFFALVQATASSSLFGVGLRAGRPEDRLALEPARDDHVQPGKAAREAVGRALGRYDVDLAEPLHDLLPEDLQLQLGEAIADAAVDAEPERHVVAHVRAVDPVVVGPLDHGLVAVAGEIPHGDLLACADGLAGQLDVRPRRAAHVGERGLVADGLGDQRRVGVELGALGRIAVELEDRAGHGVARRVVAADDQQDQVPEELLRLHVLGGR